MRALTTVAGNVSLDKTTRNALRMLALIGRPDIPVGAGAEKPLHRELVTAEHVHGESGLGLVHEPGLPEPVSAPDARGAVELMADEIRASSEPVTFIAIGPLTNVATFLERHPELKPGIRRMILMGGSIGPGNATPAAEFNVYVDPEAARAVFGSGVPITMVGLDATQKAIAGDEHLGRLRSMGEIGQITAELLLEPEWRPKGLKGGEAQPVHDAVAVAAALEPGVLVTSPMRVEVECAGEHTTGETVCDVAGVGGKPPNAEVAVDLDRERIMEILIDSGERLQIVAGEAPG